MKKYLVFVFVATISSAQAQFSWKYRDSESVARSLVKQDNMVTETHAIYEKKVRIHFDWDEEEDKPIVVEEGVISIVSLLGGVRYRGSFYQSPKEQVVELYSLSKNETKYNLPRVTRSTEDDAIFSQDGEYVAYATGSRSYFGDISQIGYTKVYNDVGFFTSKFFRDAAYIENGHLEVWIPEWMDAEIVEYHFKGNGIKKSKDRKVEYKKKSRTDPWRRLDDKIKYTVYTYDYEKVDGYESISMAPGATHYVPHLLFLNKSYNHKGDSKTLFSEAGDLYKWYSSLVEELEDEPSSELGQIADSLANGAKTDLDKIRSIFYWVQENIRYIAFEDGIAGFKPEEASNVCSYRYGDCKGMANLTKAMLKHLGFDARLTWIGTKRIFYNYDQPTLSADNHMICTVILDGEKMFLDPTERYVALGDYAYRIQGRQVLIEDGKDYIRDSVPEFDAKHNMQTFRATATLKGGKLVGSVTRTYQGESKKAILASYASIKNQNKEKALTNFLSRSNKNINVTNVSKSDFEEREKDLKLTYNYELLNNRIAVDNRIMLQLDWDQDYYYFDIDKKRKAPLEFGGKKYSVSEVNFTMPYSYTVEQMPQSVDIDRDKYSFSISYQQDEGRIVMTKKLVIKNSIIPKEDLKQWNEDIATLRAAYDSYLILKKS